MIPTKSELKAAEEALGELATQFNNCVADFPCNKKKHDGQCCKMTIVGLAWGNFAHHKNAIAQLLASQRTSLLEGVRARAATGSNQTEMKDGKTAWIDDKERIRRIFAAIDTFISSFTGKG